ncbi:ribonuclease H-like domain-containing protein [Luteimonas deserti]|uniref:Ribonuclease H-like domain-containing protein n=1 Tax=Luteimonas deserti TaxID=2752306 RepID=A0A7Z0TUD7_9GAMM|nr:ribonuclease H-like domain-containing protein [Luteimonas deserti]NYZ62751.1 ribonuclease H-like domain-containing protein [Luteimonas deserti]
MSALGKRLGLLRSQAGTVLPAVAPTPPLPTATRAHWPRADGERSPEEVVAQLRRLMKLRVPTPASRPAGPIDRALPGEEIAPGLRYLEQIAPWPHEDGPLALYDIRHEPAQRSDLLAFDTETTGLAGGTGTRAFMIGAADFVDGALRIRQLCITTLGAEREMLKTFSTWLRPSTVLVSYNGRSYDRPLLTTRYRLARLRDPLIELRHVDLLHPVRRRYRGVWANCKLATVERELLGVLREDDLPGSEAPAAWLAYLRGGSADKLRRVGLHNAQDLRSLFGVLEAMRDAACVETVVVPEPDATLPVDCMFD